MKKSKQKSMQIHPKIEIDGKGKEEIDAGHKLQDDAAAAVKMKYDRVGKFTNSSGMPGLSRKKFDFQARKKAEYMKEQSAKSELLLNEDPGFLEAEDGEKTYEISQHDIVKQVDITSATKFFDIDLPHFGPYRINYSRNGRFLALAGRVGHVAAFDWISKKLLCEINVMESTHDVTWLHQETMFAVAQKKWLYMYDNQGIELHCIKQMDYVLRIEYLPYHFLLASSSASGRLSWLDISVGQMVSSYNAFMGRLDVMCQNSSNGIIVTGSNKGLISMWSPNQKDHLVQMFCHRRPLRGVAVDSMGTYMATAAVDGQLKIWDLRKYKCLHTYRIGPGASQLTFSQNGLLAISMRHVVEVYKDCCIQEVHEPYMKHKLRSNITDLRFCPFEDVLGIGHERGFTSILIPGAGEPNFDALENNPYQTKSQRREAEVKALLEKIPADLIDIDSNFIGNVIEEKVDEKNEKSKVEFTPRKKTKGKGKSVGAFRRKKGVEGIIKRKIVAGAVNEKLKKKKKTDSVDKEAIKTPILDRFKSKKKK